MKMDSELAQRKRVGLITQRSYDRNVDSLFLPLVGAKGGCRGVEQKLFLIFDSDDRKEKRRSCRESNPDLGIQSPQ